jgi:hypothetical protein
VVLVAAVPTFFVDGILNGTPATLAGVVLFVVLAAVTLVPLVLWLRAVPAR